MFIFFSGFSFDSALPQNRIFTFKQLKRTHTHTWIAYIDSLFRRCPLLLLFNSHFMPFNLLFALCFCPVQLNSWLEQLHLSPRILSNPESIKYWAVIKNQKCVFNHCNSSNQRKFIKSQSKYITYECVSFEIKLSLVFILCLSKIGNKEIEYEVSKGKIKLYRVLGVVQL